MIDIEQQAINTFQKNYTYFTSSHPALYQKINILQSAIEANQYIENYSLEYINGYFDIKELSSGQMLYGSSSIEHAQKTANNVNLKKNESVIETFYNFPYTKENIEDLDKLTIINSYMTGTAPIVRFVNEHTSPADEMKKIYKFIFFGVGVGEHLSTVDKKIKADSYLVIEDNLELFRLSMFVTDYEELGKKARLFFSVMDTPGEFKFTYNLFAEDMLIRNSHLKFYLLTDSYAPKIKQIQNFAVTKSNLVYPYNYLLHKNLLVSHAIHQNYNFLNVSKPYIDSPFSDKPILYLAAGPSLNSHMDWIKEHQDNFIIVAVFMITSKLEKAGIIPDIVIHVDEAKEPVESTLNKLNSKEFLKESIFILAASAPLELFVLISKKENTFLIEDRTHYKKDHGFIEFFSVGEVGYALSLIFGARDIYLLGLDLALDQETGKTHAEGHSTLDEVDIRKGDTGPENTSSLRETLLTVKGNKQPSVLTTPLFDTSIHQVNYFTKLYKQADQNIYNLSNGAYFDDNIAVDVSDIETYNLDKKTVKSILYDYLKANSTDTLSDTEKNNIIIRKNEVKKKAKQIERFTKLNIKNDEDFRSQFTALIESLITPVSYELNEVSEIFFNYFQTIGNYIGNFLNTEHMSRSELIVKELQKIISRQLYKILHDIGNFEFNYINGEKYFDVGEGKSFQNKILDLKIKASPVSKIDEIYFIEKLNSEVIDVERLKVLYAKDTIGFLAVQENLSDEEFIGYIQELANIQPWKVKAICLNLKDKNEVIERFGPLVEVMLFTDIYNLVNNIEVYLYSGYFTERPLYVNLIKHSEIACLDMQERSKKMKIIDIDTKNREHDIFINLNKFGLTQEILDQYANSYTRILYERIYHNTIDKEMYIDVNDDAFEFYQQTRIAYIMENEKYKKEFIQLVKKFIS